MASSPKPERTFGVLAGRLMARYTRFVRATSTITLEPADTPARFAEFHPFVLAMWHGQFVLMPTLRELHGDGYKVAAIVARHKDAIAIRTLLGRFDISVVSGAGAGLRKRDRGGAAALRGAVRLLADDATLSMTADIPPGPARVAGIGIATIAKYSGRPVVPLAVATSRFIALPTWSRMTLNLPFSKLAYVVGDPVWVPADAGDEVLEERRRAIETGLNRVTERAYALVGADVRRIAPPADLQVPAGPVAPGLSLKIYSAGTRLLRYALPTLLWVRERQGKEDPARRSERYGVASLPRPAGPLMWLHAASVGETNAVLPLIEKLLARRSDVSILLTTGTLTSAALARRRLGPRAFHQYIVHDAPACVASFLDHWKPNLGVFAESEVWPNLIMAASERKIPLALVNARMSRKSSDGWRRIKGMARALFSRFDLVLAQNDQLARTFTSLGARHVRALGNLKIDAPPPVVDAVELDRLRQALSGRRIMVAASTHDPEEGVVADAHIILARRMPGFCTIIAPRHPARARAIADMLKAKGLSVARRSLGELPDAATDVYVADTIGELGTLYALTNIAFIGGSLIPHGGQNPIEAIGHGAVVLTGPNWSNFRDFYRALLRHKGAREVKSAEELAAAVETVLEEEGEMQRMRQGAQAALASLSGALDGTIEALAGMLPPVADQDVRARAS